MVRTYISARVRMPHQLRPFKQLCRHSRPHRATYVPARQSIPRPRVLGIARLRTCRQHARLHFPLSDNPRPSISRPRVLGSASRNSTRCRCLCLCRFCCCLNFLCSLTPHSGWAQTLWTLFLDFRSGPHQLGPFRYRRRVRQNWKTAFFAVVALTVTPPKI